MKENAANSELFMKKHLHHQERPRATRIYAITAGGDFHPALRTQYLILEW